MNEDIILLAYGDMLRVPVNVPRARARTLEAARTQGADVRPVASPIEAARIARENPDSAGGLFRRRLRNDHGTDCRACCVEGVPDNLFILLSGRLTWPAVAMLLNSDDRSFDALVAPGHVATIMGPEEWDFVVSLHDIPAAVAGFTTESLLAAMYSTLRQLIEGRRFLDNCYPEVVRPGGNRLAQQHLHQVMDVCDANWRGIGVIPYSGFVLNETCHAHDARLQFPSYADDARRRAGEMPPGCDCAKVVLGRIYPNECRLFGTACQPRHPIGPCMVSDEGACRIWWSGGMREPARPEENATPVT